LAGRQRLLIALRPPPADARRSCRLVLLLAALLAPSVPPAAEIAVDVGHTLAEPGATSARGRPEFDFNRVLAERLVGELQVRRLMPRLINFDGRIAQLAARPEQAVGAHLLISIHHDSVHADLLQEWDWDGTIQTYSDLHSGFALFVSRRNPDLAMSLRCASAVGARLRRLGFSPATHHARPQVGPTRPAADEDNAVHYYDNLVVLHRSTTPALLFEAGVIKHRAEELSLRDPKQQDRMADAIATGLAACLFTR